MMIVNKMIGGDTVSLTFYLVRHAIKEKAVGDVSITKEGVVQAQATARYFSSLPIHAIISSPLLRARETARYIALETNTSIEVDQRLRERANWGDLPGQTFDEFIKMWDRCTAEPDYIPPVGDTPKQACDRMLTLLSDIASNNTPDRNVVIVTHGGLITDFVVNTFSEAQLNVWHPRFIAEQNSLISECSITKLVYRGGRFQIETFASVEHLT